MSLLNNPTEGLLISGVDDNPLPINIDMKSPTPSSQAANQVADQTNNALSKHGHQDSVDTLTPVIVKRSSSIRSPVSPANGAVTSPAPLGSSQLHNDARDEEYSSSSTGHAWSLSPPPTSRPGTQHELDRLIRENKEINSLLKEQVLQLNQVQQQNSKLWSLVNKQREMIFELQNDLNELTIDRKSASSPNPKSLTAAASSSSSQTYPVSRGAAHSKLGDGIAPAGVSQPSSNVSDLQQTQNSNEKALEPDGQERNKIRSRPPTGGLAGSASLSGTPSPTAISVPSPGTSSKRSSIISSPIGMEASRRISKVLSLNRQKSSSHLKADAEAAANPDQLADLSSSILDSSSGTIQNMASTPDSANTPTTPVSSSHITYGNIIDQQGSRRSLSYPMSYANSASVSPQGDHHAVQNHEWKKRPSVPIIIKRASSPLDPSATLNPVVANQRSSIAASSPNTAALQPSPPRSPAKPPSRSSLTDAPCTPLQNDSEATLKEDLNNNNSFRRSVPAAGRPAREPPAADSLTQPLPLPPPPESQVETYVCMNPNQLSSFRVTVASALLGKVSPDLKTGKEDPAAVFSVGSISTGKEIWQFMKSYTQLMELDTIIRPHVQDFSMPRLPERSLFGSQAPVKVDVRKQLLNGYFASLLSIPHLPLMVKSHVAKFMSFDIVQLNQRFQNVSAGQVQKHGFLTKRGRNFGGWKTRFFALNGPFLNYFDRPDGELVGTVIISGARIGRQRFEDEVNEDEDKQFRHAFLIVEAKREKEVRHVFCAESDEERDAWIEALLTYVHFDLNGPENDGHFVPMTVKPWSVRHDLEDSEMYFSSSDLISGPMNGYRIADSPTEWKSLHNVETFSSSPNNAADSGQFDSRRPSKVSTIHTIGSTEDGESTEVTQKSKTPRSGVTQKKKSFFGLRSRMIGSASSSSSDGHDDGPTDSGVFSSNGLIGSLIPGGARGSVAGNSLDSAIEEEKSEVIKVFGSNLADCVRLSSHNMNGCIIPSILYRTTEFLNARNAYFEEGIFRINGSSSQIRMLVNRFDEDHDVNLLEMEGVDVNTVCGLLKKWLMGLPDPILTSELDNDFKLATEIKDPFLRNSRHRYLLQMLPKENHDMLSVLCGFMSLILEHQHLNKMNIKNLSIIFSQTLNMSSTVFIGFLVEYHTIFGTDSVAASTAEIPEQLTTPGTSPRKTEMVIAGLR